jgi:hypothetical protein
MITKDSIINNYPIFKEIASQDEIDKIYKFIQPLLISYLNRRNKVELIDEFKNDYVCDSINFLSHLIQVCGSIHLSKMSFDSKNKIIYATFTGFVINSIIANVTNELGYFQGKDEYFSLKTLRILIERLINSYNEANALSPEIRKLMQDDLMNTYIYSKV